MSQKGKQQSSRLTTQQKALDGVTGIFDDNAQQHDKEVYDDETLNRLDIHKGTANNGRKKI